MARVLKYGSTEGFLKDIGCQFLGSNPALRCVRPQTFLCQTPPPYEHERTVPRLDAVGARLKPDGLCGIYFGWPAILRMYVPDQGGAQPSRVASLSSKRSSTEGRAGSQRWACLTGPAPR